MDQNEQIAAALGKRLWKTDAFLPDYRAGECGSWRIDPGGQLVHDWGYHSGVCFVEMLPSLARKTESGWETWMSLTPHEIESQELGFAYANGKVVVMGLGMGWVAANMALNADVNEVVIVENDREVIELFSSSGALESIPQDARRKIAIEFGNALGWRPKEPIDFLYVDIWLQLAEPQTLQEVRKMHADTQAEQIYFWGQEILLHSATQQIIEEGKQIDDQAIALALDEIIKLPLIVPSHIDYPGMIESVIRNRIERGLPTEFLIE